jgi:hypothetical protein
METKVAVYGPNLATSGETFHVHAVGCSDTRRILYRGHVPIVFDPDDIPGSANETIQETIAGEIYSDQIREHESNDDGVNVADYVEDFKFFPCVERNRL